MKSNIITFRTDPDINDGIEIIKKYLKDNAPGTKIKRSDAIRYAIAMSALSIIQENYRREAEQS